jgi:hypothetical protein
LSCSYRTMDRTIWMTANVTRSKSQFQTSFAVKVEHDEC